MLTNSPLIENGTLTLTKNGDLVIAPDIKTQMYVSITGYNCIFDDTLESSLIPYINNIPVGGRQQNSFVSIIKNALTPVMIGQGLINNVQIFVYFPTYNSVKINIDANDSDNNPITLNWTNP